MANTTQDEGMGDYAGMLHATVVKMEEDAALQQDIPILGEYCWMHDGPGNGGWSCRECYEDQRD